MPFRGFVSFIREKGVVGLAVGFLLGGAVSKLVTALIDDVINPLLGLLFSKVGNLADASFTVGAATVLWGHLVSTLINFVVISAVVYFGVKGLRLDRVDKKPDAADPVRTY